MKRWVVGVALAAAGLASPGGAGAVSIQEAILRAKPGVALISAEVRAEVTMNCGRGPVTVAPAPFVETGTGWFIDGRGYLITNAHVVDPVHRLPPWVTHELKKKAVDQACVEPVLRERGLARGQRPELEEQLRRDAAGALAAAKMTTDARLTVLISNGEALAAEVVKFSPPLLLDMMGRPTPDSGRDLALLRIPRAAYPALALAARDPKIGDPIHILGFPGVVLTHELLSQTSTPEPSVTNGAVSGLRPDAIGQEVIQTDAPATHGNSGGPAITDDSTVVGVMTFVSLSPSGGALVQGFNFLIPAKDVAAFVQGTDVRPGESEFSGVWAAGLRALFTERYPLALGKFREANGLLPGLADVRRALAEAEEKVKNPPPRPFPWAWATAGVTVLSLGIFGGMFARRWWQNRFRVQPTQVVGFMEHGQNPIMLDARTAADFETSPLKLPGALRLDPAEAEAGRIALDVDRSQVIVTYCTSPAEATSARVAHLLRQRGYRNVRILKGGLGGWTNARLPVEAKSHLPSIGLEIYKNLSLGDVARRRFKAGEVIFSQGGDAQGEAFVIHDGTVEIRKEIDGHERVLARLGEGELFGEMALFRRSSRSASAVAQSEVELLVIQNERLDWLIRNRPQLTMEILKRLSEWVVTSDKDRGDVR